MGDDMRDIEFRGWCENKKEWEEHKCVLTQEGRLLQINKRGQLIPHFKGHTIEFYTGLKDKNGKKMFEGDTLKSSVNGKKWTVYYSEAKYAWCIQNNNLISESYPLYQYKGFGSFKNGTAIDRLEIIGNIHEGV